MCRACRWPLYSTYLQHTHIYVSIHTYVPIQIRTYTHIHAHTNTQQHAPSAPIPRVFQSPTARTHIYPQCHVIESSMKTAFNSRVSKLHHPQSTHTRMSTMPCHRVVNETCMNESYQSSITRNAHITSHEWKGEGLQHLLGATKRAFPAS